MTNLNVAFEVVASSCSSLIGTYIFDRPELYKSQGAYHLFRNDHGVWTFILHDRPFYTSTTRSEFPVGLNWCSYPGKSTVSVIIEKIFTVKSSSRNTLAAMYGNISQASIVHDSLIKARVALQTEKDRNSRLEQDMLASSYDAWYATEQLKSLTTSASSSPAKVVPPTILRTSSHNSVGLNSPTTPWQPSTSFGSSTTRPSSRSTTPTQLSRPTGQLYSSSVPRSPLPGAQPIISVGGGVIAYPPFVPSEERAATVWVDSPVQTQAGQHAGSPMRHRDQKPPPSPITVSAPTLSNKPAAVRAVYSSPNQSFSTPSKVIEDPLVHKSITELWREQKAAQDAQDAREAKHARDLREREVRAEAEAERRRGFQDLCEIYSGLDVHHPVYNPVSSSPPALSRSHNDDHYKAAAAKAGEDARRAGEELQAMQERARSASRNRTSVAKPEVQPQSLAHTDARLSIQTFDSPSKVAQIGLEVPSPRRNESPKMTPPRVSHTPVARTPITAYPSSPLLHLVPLSSIKKDRPLSSSRGSFTPERVLNAFPDLEQSTPAPPASSPLRPTSNKPERSRAVSVGRSNHVTSAYESSSPSRCDTGVETAWVDTHIRGEDDLSRVISELHGVSPNNSALETELKNLYEGIIRHDSSAAISKSAERAAVDRAHTLAERFGQTHVLRDSPSVSSSPNQQSFPSGSEVIRLFRKDFQETSAFEFFAIDARDVIGQVWPNEDPHKILVHHVLLPLHQETLKYVNKKVRASQKALAAAMGIHVPQESASASSNIFKQMWLLTRQLSLYKEISALSDRDVSMLFADIEAVTFVHSALQGGVRIGHIDSSHMTIPALVRRLLRAHALAALSDPHCTLYPAPGTVVNFKSDQSQAILERAWEGDKVEVVLSGLYFGNPGGDLKCVVPALVRPV